VPLSAGAIAAASTHTLGSTRKFSAVHGRIELPQSTSIQPHHRPHHRPDLQQRRGGVQRARHRRHRPAAGGALRVGEEAEGCHQLTR